MGARAAGGRLNAGATRLARSDDLIEAARRILAEERRRLDRVGVAGELVLVGGSSVPGALTRGDVDLHLRVVPAAFPGVVAALRSVHRVVHPEIWCSTLATFTVDTDLPTGIAVTPVGSEHDVRFTVTWRRLRAEPALLEEYNALKTGPATGYEERKSAFFDAVVAGSTRSGGRGAT